MRKTFLMLAVLGLSALAHATNFGYTGTIVGYTVSTTGTYYIVADGAQGGFGAPDPGGLGALAAGNVYLTAGTQLDFVVGGQGLTGNFVGPTFGIFGGGGGGGTFVYIVGAPNPLIVAGGGGGAGFCCGRPGDPGVTTTAGSNGNGPSPGSGGVAGSGGAAGSNGIYDGAGGGGWASNGATTTDTAVITNQAGGGGGAFTFLGGAGDGVTSILQFANGGFGGGGGGGYQGGGGGGGYSGGGGGSGGAGGGGGGGSYIDPSFTYSSLTGDANAGDGSASITLTPEPSSLLMFGTGLVGFAGFIRRKIARKA